MSRASKNLRVMYQHRALAAVYNAVKSGALPRITAETQCVDCGGAASVYEHREYTRPLDVEPVCDPCNYKRGPATFDLSMVMEDLQRPECEIVDGRCTKHPTATLVAFCSACKKAVRCSCATRKTEPKAKP